MCTVFILFMLISKIVVFAIYQEDKLSSGDSIKYFHVTPFLFENYSIHLNITWRNLFGNDSVKEIFIESYDVDEGCTYSGSDNVSDYNSIVIPNPNNTDSVENIAPGCVYLIYLESEGEIISENYTVPECVEDYCACITEKTNLIKLRNVESVKEHIYRVHYTSRNTSLAKGNYYITKILYVNENTDDRFDVPKLKYFKESFEIAMEYLKEKENYSLIIQYKDADNINPYCEYISRLSFTAQFPAKHYTYMAVKIIGIILSFLFAFILLCCFTRRTNLLVKALASIKKLLFSGYEECPTITKIERPSFRLPHEEVNALYTPMELTKDPFEFPRENIIIKHVLGEGAFGKVYYAKAYNLNGIPGFTMVAVKLLRDDAPKEEQDDFRAEINMLKKIGVHRNIVKFLGCVTRYQPYMTIMELVANGDLKEYLLKLRDIWIKNKNKRLFFPDDMEESSLKHDEEDEATENKHSFDANMKTPPWSELGGRPEPVLDHRELEMFAFQIATGMAYLEKIPVTHRDLAARNILITKEKVLKISDFGMSRSGPYVNYHLRKVPLRWMAIEAIEDFKTDSKSDVWSFGVVLWEIGTLGALPYEDIPNDLIPKALKLGVRLPRPEICTDELYALMQNCWMQNPKDRPTFADIVEHFKTKKVYVDFKRLSPDYVFPSTAMP